MTTYAIKKVAELQPGDVLAHGVTVSKSPVWFAGGWRSHPHWSVEVDGDPTKVETYKPNTAEALLLCLDTSLIGDSEE